MKKIFLLPILLINCFAIFGQDLSVDETIKYINDKLAANPFISYYKTTDYYSISVSKEGMLYIYSYEDKIQVGIKEMFIKQIDITKSFEKCPSDQSVIKIYCKLSDGTSNNETGYFINSNKCVKYTRQKENDVLYENYCFVMFNNGYIIGESLCNAFRHLFKSVLSNPVYFPSDPNDPFASKPLTTKANSESEEKQKPVTTSKNNSGTQNTEAKKTPSNTSNEQTAIEYYNLGNKYKNEKNYISAITFYQKAIELKSDYYKAYNNMGIAQEAIGKNDDALKSYSNAVKYNSSYYEAYNNRGLFRGKVLKDYIGAISDFNQAIKINPKYADGFMNRGVANGKSGNYKEQIKDCNTAIILNPNYTEAYFNRGAAEYNLGDKEAACKDFYKSWKLGLMKGYQEYHNNCEL